MTKDYDAPAAAGQGGDELIVGRDRAFWGTVRTEYEETDEPVQLICERHEISLYALKRATDMLGWRKRRPARFDRRDITMRMFRLLDTQIRILEAKMTKAGEAEVNVLGKLVATLDKLMAIRRADEPAPPRSAKSAREMSDIKQRLVERIEQLKRG